MITANIAVIACANPTQPGTVLAVKITEVIAPGPANRGLASGKTETSSFSSPYPLWFFCLSLRLSKSISSAVIKRRITPAI